MTIKLPPRGQRSGPIYQAIADAIGREIEAGRLKPGSRLPTQRSLARQLGAHYYIDAIAQDAVTELQKLGGARVILATAPNAQAISALVEGLSPSGTLLVPAVLAEPLTISVLSLISGRRSVAGWYAGTARDAQDTLEFSVLSAVHPMIEQYPLGRVAEAYEQMHSGRVRFRVVLTVDG